MKLLPLFTSYIKDAAKSVKRITLQEFKEVADETLTELLGIASIVVNAHDKGLFVTPVDENVAKTQTMSYFMPKKLETSEHKRKFMFILTA